MKIKAKLFGLFIKKTHAYDPDNGIEIDLSGSPTVQDLLEHLDIKTSDGAVVILEGRVLGADTRLAEDMRLSVFPVPQGG